MLTPSFVCSLLLTTENFELSGISSWHFQVTVLFISSLLSVAQFSTLSYVSGMVKSVPRFFMHFILTNIALTIPLTPQKTCHKENVKFDNPFQFTSC